jgi:hypothetical protein
MVLYRTGTPRLTAEVPNWYKAEWTASTRSRHSGNDTTRRDVNRVDVTRWENGTRKPGRKSLPKIAERTGIAPAALRPDLAQMMNGSEPAGVSE